MGMKLVKTVMTDLALVLLTPFYLVGLILGLPYLAWRWIEGMIQTAQGHAPSYETEFDSPREYGRTPAAPRIDETTPSLQAYIHSSTEIHNTYNSSVDNSTHIDNSTDSHAQTINNYYFTGQPPTPRQPTTIDTAVTFTPDPSALDQDPERPLPPAETLRIQAPSQTPALPEGTAERDEEVKG